MIRSVLGARGGGRTVHVVVTSTTGEKWWCLSVSDAISIRERRPRQELLFYVLHRGDALDGDGRCLENRCRHAQRRHGTGVCFLHASPSFPSKSQLSAARIGWPRVAAAVSSCVAAGDGWKRPSNRTEPPTPRAPMRLSSSIR
jgi:hypothetical protein